MARTEAEMDAILELACFCDEMSVMKTQWFGPNAGRRFRACWNNSCGYRVWVDEEALCPRTLEIIKELQERALDGEEKWRRKLIRYIERHESEMDKMKKKKQATAADMFMIVSMMMNLVVNTSTDDTVVSIEDYDELDE